MQEQVLDNPLKNLEIEFLHAQIKKLHKSYFDKKKITIKTASGKAEEKDVPVDSATERELQIGARLARSEFYHLPVSY